MNNTLFFTGLLILCLLSACVQKKFEEPNTNSSANPSFAIYKTIAELRSSMGFSGVKEIKENVLISGVVIADDRSGNFYKQIIIDDGTAAIPLLLDANNLYNDFPIGQKVYVKCQGLYTAFYYKLPQLGYVPDSRGLLSSIPFHLWNQFIIKSEERDTIKAIEVSIADAMKAKPELFNRLVTITDAQVLDTALVQQYALPSSLSSATNIQLADCDSNFLILRTSGYSSFHSKRPPLNRGKLTAIYAVFNNTPQLILRDTSDVAMDLPRCF